MKNSPSPVLSGKPPDLDFMEFQDSPLDDGFGVADWNQHIANFEASLRSRNRLQA